MVKFDKGPPAAVQKIFEAVPSFAVWQPDCWLEWGPIFYRGRLDKSAKVLVIASDPGPTERIACRTLVGDAGQRVQGFLDKLGLTTSYVCLNASPYAIFPNSQNHDAIVNDPGITAWRNSLFKAVTGPKLKAIVAFGVNAHKAIDGWAGKPAAAVVHKLRHPSAQPDGPTLAQWGPAVTGLRGVVTPDPGGSNTGPNYGAAFVPADWKRIPSEDLPFGVPPWLGDDAKNRAKNPQRFNCCQRDPQNLRFGMEWEVP